MEHTKIDWSKRTMAKTVDYKKLLKKLDEEYFDYLIEDICDKCGHTNKNKKITFDDVCHALATYLYDTDFDIDEEGWKTSEEIRKSFGQKVWFQSLKNLFMRHHDT